MEQTKKSSGAIKIMLGIVISLTLLFLVNHFFFKTTNDDNPLSAMAEEINAQCPMLIDRNTRLDHTVALPNQVFQYNYTLLNFSAATTNVEALKTQVEPIITNSIKTAPDMKAFRDQKMTMNYQYKDSLGIFMFELSISPEKYLEQ